MSLLSFTPSDVMRDWNRFRGSWVTIVKDDGTPRVTGLFELTDVMHPDEERPYDDEDEFGGERIPEDAQWHEVTLEGRCIRDGEYRNQVLEMEEGDVITFAPKWPHSGYAMVQSDGDSDAPNRLVWIALSSQRQYRYGLSLNAFEIRNTHNFNMLGLTMGIDTARTAFQVYLNGPRHHEGRVTGELSRYGLSLSSTIALHHITGGVGALCHHSRRVIGWYLNDTIYAEEGSQRLLRNVEGVEYVTSARLAELWATTILPARLRSGVATRNPPSASPELTPVAIQVGDLGLDNLQSDDLTRTWARWAATAAAPSVGERDSATSAALRRVTAFRNRNRE